MNSKLTQQLSGKDKALIVFTHFSAIYLQKWNSLFKTDDSLDSCAAIWGKELDAIPVYQILFAIKHLRMRIECDEWPPNLFEFSRLCAGITEGSVELYAKPQITYLGYEGAMHWAYRELDKTAINDPVALFEKIQPQAKRVALGIDSTNILDFKV